MSKFKGYMQISKIAWAAVHWTTHPTSKSKSVGTETIGLVD
jgi:hypothetical protein